MHFLKGLSAAVLVCLLLSACGTSPQAAPAPDGKARSDHPANQLRKVQTTKAEQKSIDELVVVTGTLAADQEVVLGFKVSGRLAEIPVDLGTAVQKGGSV